MSMYPAKGGRTMSGRRVDIYTETYEGGNKWNLYVAGVARSCWRRIVAALEAQGETVLVTATPGRSGLGRNVYVTGD